MGGTLVPDDPTQAQNKAELFQRTQSADTVTPASGTMGVTRWRDAAVTMLDGRALVVGGAQDDPAGCTGTMCRTGDLFDPTTNTFKTTANLLTESRTFVWGVLMVDGRVMFTSDHPSANRSEQGHLRRGRQRDTVSRFVHARPRNHAPASYAPRFAWRAACTTDVDAFASAVFSPILATAGSALGTL